MSNLTYFVVDQLEAHLPFKPAGPEERRFCCPFCLETDYKFYINAEREKFICFKCEVRSGYKNFVTVYAQVFGITYKQAKDRLALYIEKDIPEDVDTSLEWLIEDKTSTEKVVSLPALPGMPKGSFPYNGDPAFNYLLDRGFTTQDLVDLDVYGVGDADNLVYKSNKVVGNLRNRVIFPVYDFMTRDLVSWMARATYPVDKWTPKYLNAPGTELAKVIAPAVLQRNTDIVLVEGYIDAIATRRAGLPAYCSFGKKLSAEQLELIKVLAPRSVTVWFDQGAEGSMEGAASRLKEVLGRRKVFMVDPSLMPTGVDAGETMKMPDGPELLKEVYSKRFTLDSTEYFNFKLRRALND
jgi:DNA primase